MASVLLKEIEMNVYILCGLPGSGKSTWAAKRAKDSSAMIINKDSLRTMFYGSYRFDGDLEYIIGGCTVELVKKILEYNVKDLIIDEYNLTRSKRSFWIDLIDTYLSEEKRKECKIFLVWFKENTRNLSLRTAGDLRGYSIEYWGKAIESMKNSFEDPVITEYFDEIIEISLPQ